MRPSLFGQTGLVIARADREVDPYTHIDHIREEVFDHKHVIAALDDRILILEAAERERLTKTGVWTYVEAKLDAQKVGWMKWGIRAALLGTGGAILEVLRWLITRAMH